MSTIDQDLTAAMDEAFDPAELATEQPEPSVRQAQTRDEFEAEIDKGLDEHERLRNARDGIEEKPQPEPERDFSKVVEAALDLNISLGGVAHPGRFADFDAEQLQDENAVRERLLELQSNADATTEHAARLGIAQANAEQLEQNNQEALDLSRQILDSGDGPKTWETAKRLRENFPDVYDSFLAEWADTDPDSARTFVAAHPPIDWQAREAEQAAQGRMFAAALEAHEREEHSRAVGEAFSEHEAELRADPKAAPYVDQAFNLIAAQAEADPTFGVASPDEARRLLTASVKAAREVQRATREARSDARDLLELDRRAHIQMLAAGDTDEAWNEEEALERLTDEQLRFRDPRRQNEDLLMASFDAALAKREQSREEYESWSPEFVAAQEKRIAESFPWRRSR